jgi:hypothetical protein
LKPLADNMKPLRAKAVEPIGLGWNTAGLQPDGGSQASILLLRRERDTENKQLSPNWSERLKQGGVNFSICIERP